MTNQFENHLSKHAQKICDGCILDTDTLVVDAVITIQKVLNQASEIMTQVKANHKSISLCKLLILSAKMEIIYDDLISIKHEYNL